MNRIRLTALAGLTAFGITTLAEPAMALAMTRESMSRLQDEGGVPTLDITYDGGNARDYLASVRQAARDANIVVDDEAMEVPIGRVELRGVDLWAAVHLVHELRSDREGVQRLLHVEVINGNGGNQIYRVQAVNSGRPQSIPTQTKVWTVAALKIADLGAENILTAIETAVAMQEDLGAPDIKYHDGASLVIARGHPAQIETIDQVIDAMMRARVESREQDARMREAAFEIERVMTRVEGLESELQRARAQIDSLERSLSDSRAEKEALQRELGRTGGGDQ